MHWPVRIRVHMDYNWDGAQKIERSANLGDGLGLLGLLCLICRNTLGLDPLSLLILVVRPEQVNLVVIILFLLCRSSGSGDANEGLTCGAGARKRVELGRVGVDVSVPTCDSRVSRGVRSRSDGLEDVHVCLRGSVSGEI